MLTAIRSSISPAVTAENLTVEVVIVGPTLPESIVSLVIQGPAYDVAIEEVRQLYTNVTFISTHLLFSEHCEHVGDELEVRLARWYYNKSFFSNTTVFLTPSKYSHFRSYLSVVLCEYCLTRRQIFFESCFQICLIEQFEHRSSVLKY